MDNRRVLKAKRKKEEATEVEGCQEYWLQREIETLGSPFIAAVRLDK